MPRTDGAKNIDDWADIEVRFITGTMSQRELADEYDVKYEAVRNRASKYNWTQKREQYRQKFKTKIQERTKVHLESIKAEFDSFSDRACKIAAAYAAHRLTEFYGDKQNPFNNPKILTINEVSNLIGIIENSQRVIYRQLDIPMPTQRIIDITPAPVESIDESEIARIIDEKIASGAVLVPFKLDIDTGGNGGKPGNGSGNEDSEISPSDSLNGDDH